MHPPPLLELCISAALTEYIWYKEGAMEDTAIKLLYINSAVHALILINQAPAGETGAGAVTQPIAANSSFFISMLPLENEPGCVYLPYTRRVSIASKGAVFAGDGLIDLCMWPDSIVELTLYPETAYRNDETELHPSVLSPFDFYIGGERHTAFIYNEACSSFVVEHAGANRLKFAAPLPFFVASADIGFVKYGETPVLHASGETLRGERFICAAHILPSFGLDICTVCEEASVEPSGIVVVTGGEFRQTKTRWEKRGEGLSPAAGELGWYTCPPRQASSAYEICAALLEAVKAGMREAALSCLTPSLAEGLSFEDLKEFFGGFDAFTPTISPACSQSGIALKYAAGKNLFVAREFCVETRQKDGALLIDNIREP